MEPTFPNRSPLQFEDLRELIEVSVKTTYFHLENKLYIKMGANDGQIIISINH
jgi:hypothetical protein